MLNIGDRVVDIKNINNLNTSEIKNKAGVITEINDTNAHVEINGQTQEISVHELIKLSLVINNE
jgi:hypothetical protein